MYSHFSGSPGATYNCRLARQSVANEVVRGVQRCGWWEGLSGSQWRGSVCDQWSMMGDHPAQPALRPGMANPPTPRSKSWPSYNPAIKKKLKNAQSLKSKQKTCTNHDFKCFQTLKKKNKSNLKTERQAQCSVWCKYLFLLIWVLSVLTSCVSWLFAFSPRCLPILPFPLLCSLPCPEHLFEIQDWCSETAITYITDLSLSRLFVFLPTIFSLIYCPITPFLFNR